MGTLKGITPGYLRKGLAKPSQSGYRVIIGIALSQSLSAGNVDFLLKLFRKLSPLCNLICQGALWEQKSIIWVDGTFMPLAIQDLLRLLSSTFGKPVGSSEVSGTPLLSNLGMTYQIIALSISPRNLLIGKLGEYSISDKKGT